MVPVATLSPPEWLLHQVGHGPTERDRQTHHSCSGLLQEATVRPRVQSSSQIQMSLQQKVKSEMESPDWHARVSGRHPPCKTAVDVSYCHDMPGWREMFEQIHWRAKPPSQVPCVSEYLKWWGAWDTIPAGLKQGHHTIDRLEEWGVERGSDRWFSLKGREWEPSLIRRTLEPFQTQSSGNFWKT